MPNINIYVLDPSNIIRVNKENNNVEYCLTNKLTNVADGVFNTVSLFSKPKKEDTYSKALLCNDFNYTHYYETYTETLGSEYFFKNNNFESYYKTLLFENRSFYINGTNNLSTMLNNFKLKTKIDITKLGEKITLRIVGLEDTSNTLQVTGVSSSGWKYCKDKDNTKPNLITLSDIIRIDCITILIYEFLGKNGLWYSFKDFE